MTRDVWLSVLTEAIANSQEPWEIVMTTTTREGYESRLRNTRSGASTTVGTPAEAFPDDDLRSLLIRALASHLASR
jgi:hypothetical protein